MKRDKVCKSESVYVHMRRDISSPCTQLYAFWITPIPYQLRTYLIDGLFLNYKTYIDILSNILFTEIKVPKINFFPKK